MDVQGREMKLGMSCSPANRTPAAGPKVPTKGCPHWAATPTTHTGLLWVKYGFVPCETHMEILFPLGDIEVG